MELTKSFSSKVAAIAIASALVVGSFFAFGFTQARALTEDQIQSILNLLRSFGADQATIANVEAALRGQAPSGGSGSGVASSVCPYEWQRNLGPGDTGDDVKKLQQFLNERGFTVATSGAGSPGNETTYYGSRTAAAVKQFQEAYASEILAPLGLSQGTGYFWNRTRAKANELCQQAQSGGQQQGGDQGQGGQSQVPGTGLMVAPGTQPANGLFVENAARVPFTVFTVTAGADGDVTLNSVVVRKTGVIDKAAFDGVVLLDENGMQLGNAKTFNANNEATIGSPVTIKAGETRTFTVAANAPSNLDPYAGQVGGISVVGVNASAPVSGSLPITGAMHTVNATLQIGTVTAGASSFDPGADQTKEIGTTGYRFSAVRLTAGSAEDVRFKSIRFNQVGSATKDDLANVKIVVDGVEYPAEVTADGKYYYASFGNGILIGKGNSVDVYIQGDIVGSNANGRTIDFDIEEKSDIVVVGETYGYGILPTGSGGRFNNSGTPFYNGYVVTVQGGQVTMIQKSNAVPAQNIAVNVPDQPLGGFETNLTGEGMEVRGLYIGFDITAGSGVDATDLMNVVLVDENGAVVAGPVDGRPESSCGSIDGSDGCVYFSDTITFPTGVHTYTLKGRLSTDFADGDTVTAMFTADTTHFVNPKGTVTGDAYNLPGVPIVMNTMTVKGAKLAVGLASTPASQTVPAGAQNFTFANVILDATDSGEDVRLSQLTMNYEGKDASNTNLTAANRLLYNCAVYDGSTVLNGGSNIVNRPTTGVVTFTFTNPITVAKGTAKTLSVKCSVPSTAAVNDKHTFNFVGVSDIGVVTGVASQTTVTETVDTSATGATMTVATQGTFTVALADDNPTYRMVVAGATDVLVTKLKLRATNEDISLRRLKLQLSSKDSVVGPTVKIYDGSTLVGQAVFSGAASTAVADLGSGVTLKADENKVLSLMVDLNPITAQTQSREGALVQVDFKSGTETYGVGAASQATITTASADTNSEGVRVFKSYPTVAEQDLGTNALVNGAQRLYRFTVSADQAGPVKLARVTVNVATSGVTVSNLELRAFTDSNYSTQVGGFTQNWVAKAAGLVVSGDVAFHIDRDGNDNNDPAQAEVNDYLTVPAGSTIYFEVWGEVSGVDTTGDSVTVKLAGDAAYLTSTTTAATADNANMATVGDITSSGDSQNFIWSPDYNGDVNRNTDDWTNGYRVPGLQDPYTTGTTLQKS